MSARASAAIRPAAARCGLAAARDCSGEPEGADGVVMEGDERQGWRRGLPRPGAGRKAGGRAGAEPGLRPAAELGPGVPPPSSGRAKRRERPAGLAPPGAVLQPVSG